jgi:hypothetical protein
MDAVDLVIRPRVAKPFSTDAVGIDSSAAAVSSADRATATSAENSFAEAWDQSSAAADAARARSRTSGRVSADSNAQSRSNQRDAARSRTAAVETEPAGWRQPLDRSSRREDAAVAASDRSTLSGRDRSSTLSSGSSAVDRFDGSDGRRGDADVRDVGERSAAATSKIEDERDEADSADAADGGSSLGDDGTSVSPFAPVPPGLLVALVPQSAAAGGLPSPRGRNGTSGKSIDLSASASAGNAIEAAATLVAPSPDLPDVTGPMLAAVARNGSGSATTGDGPSAMSATPFSLSSTSSAAIAPSSLIGGGSSLLSAGQVISSESVPTLNRLVESDSASAATTAATVLAAGSISTRTADSLGEGGSNVAASNGVAGIGLSPTSSSLAHASRSATGHASSLSVVDGSTGEASANAVRLSDLSLTASSGTTGSAMTAATSAATESSVTAASQSRLSRESTPDRRIAPLAGSIAVANASANAAQTQAGVSESAVALTGAAATDISFNEAVQIAAESPAATSTISGITDQVRSSMGNGDAVVTGLAGAQDAGKSSTGNRSTADGMATGVGETGNAAVTASAAMTQTTSNGDVASISRSTGNGPPMSSSDNVGSRHDASSASNGARSDGLTNPSSWSGFDLSTTAARLSGRNGGPRPWPAASPAAAMAAALWGSTAATSVALENSSVLDGAAVAADPLGSSRVDQLEPRSSAAGSVLTSGLAASTVGMTTTSFNTSAGTAVTGQTGTGRLPEPATTSAALSAVVHAVTSAAESHDRFSIRLQPAEHGPLLVEVSREANQLTARLEASTASGWQLLTDHLPELQERLSHLGLAIERWDITRPEPSPGLPERSFDGAFGNPSHGSEAQRQGYGSQRDPALYDRIDPSEPRESAQAPKATAVTPRSGWDESRLNIQA